MTPSPMHRELQCRVIPWVSARATRKGVRGGVEIHTGKYVADCVALSSLQSRFCVAYGATIDGQLIGDELALIFECKVSASDYRASFERIGDPRETPAGNLHWVVTTRGLVHHDSLPETWGLLEMSGAGLREVKAPPFIYDRDHQRAMLKRLGYEILWRDGTGDFWSMYRAVIQQNNALTRQLDSALGIEEEHAKPAE